MHQKKGNQMAYVFTCQDIGVNYPFVANGETVDEVIAEASKHAKEAHGYTDNQLNDTQLMKEVKAAIKKV